MSRRFFREAPTSRANAKAWQWADSAACKGMDLELFFGPDGERLAERRAREAEAMDVCFSCPSRLACLETALGYTPSQQYGVVGGMTAEERVVIRRNRLRYAAARKEVA